MWLFFGVALFGHTRHTMGFNKRRLEDARRQEAELEVAGDATNWSLPVPKRALRDQRASFDNVVMISSYPSQKYSCSGSPLMF